MIEGTLINLRARETTDLHRCCAWINDREVTRHLTMRYPISLVAEEAWISSVASTPGSYDKTWFAIETKEGEHIGNIDFHITIPENRKARLGVMIGDKAYWSRGYGTDAMLVMLRFGFDEMNLHRIDLVVDADNERAIACYRKCGFTEEGRLRMVRFSGGRYVDQLVMGILRDEFYRRWGSGQPQEIRS